MNTISVDGRALALTIKKKLKKEFLNFESPRFHIIYVGSDPVIDNYLRYKEKFAADIGVETSIHRFSQDISAEHLMKGINDIVAFGQPCIIQLPLPLHLQNQTQEFLDLIPFSFDVDVLSTEARNLYQQGKLALVPPVAASIIEIFNHYAVSLKNKKIVLLGMGKLVGQMIAAWLTLQELPFETITKDSSCDERKDTLKKAEILISGIGIPHFVREDDISFGLVVVDAGTSEDSKGLQGDIHPEVAKLTSLFTPVPGGVGPLTIAMLYRNVLVSYQKNYVHLYSTN